MKSRKIHPSDPSDIMIQPAEENIPALVQSTLHITKSSIWKGSAFSSAQLNNIQHQLSNLFLNAASPHEAYRHLVQEILTLHNLALQNKVCQSIFLSRLSEVTSPAVIFPNTNTNVYHVIAEAVLSLVEDPSAENQHYWVEWFTKRKSCYEKEIVTIIIANLSIPSHEPL